MEMKMKMKISGEPKKCWMKCMQNMRRLTNQNIVLETMKWEKFFSQNCVISHENPTVFAFHHCVQQSISKVCFEKKDDVDMLKCIVCRP